MYTSHPWGGGGTYRGYTTRLLYQKKLAEAMANRAKGVAIWGDGGGGGGGGAWVSYGKWIMSCCIFGSSRELAPPPGEEANITECQVSHKMV